MNQQPDSHVPAAPVDLFVIGGGINGAGIARDAAGRGLSVTLAEMNDLASATSSGSINRPGSSDRPAASSSSRERFPTTVSDAVCPGAIWTAFQQRSLDTAEGDPYEQFLKRYEGVIPMGRPQTAEDVGKAVTFLASDDASNITGQCLHVDGGAILRD